MLYRFTKQKSIDKKGEELSLDLDIVDKQAIKHLKKFDLLSKLQSGGGANFSASNKFEEKFQQ
jgi:hypothetical protein